jgi:hypothetical protein
MCAEVFLQWDDIMGLGVAGNFTGLSIRASHPT